MLAFLIKQVKPVEMRK